MTRRDQVATGISVAALAVVAAAFPALVDGFRRPDIEVIIDAPLSSSDGLDVQGQVAADRADRVRRSDDLRPGPGLRLVQWRAQYRGGYSRIVTREQLVGPFQIPTSPPCSARLYVGQSFLDDGTAREGTLAAVARQVIERELRGFSQWPAGRFEALENLSIRWASTARSGVGPGDYVAVRMTLRMTRARVPVFIGVVPRLEAGKLSLTAFALADVKFGNRVYDFVADLFGAEDVASEAATTEIGHVLGTILTEPPELPIPGRSSLRVSYCEGGNIEIVPGQYAAIPMAVQLPGARAGIAAPVLHATEDPPLLSGDAPIALDVDINALNGMLHQLWAMQFLDDLIARAGIADHFNDNETVQALLSVRIEDIALRLPPTLEPAGPGAMKLAASATVTLVDGATRLPATVIASARVQWIDGGAGLVATVDVDRVDVSCEPEPNRLVACYPDLIEQLVARAPQLNGVLAARLGELLDSLLVHRRVGNPGDAGHFAIDAAALSASSGTRLRIEIRGRLSESAD